MAKEVGQGGNMSNERSPLIARTWGGASRRRGRPHELGVLGRFCTIALSSIPIWILGSCVVMLLTRSHWSWIPDCHGPPGHCDARPPEHGGGWWWPQAGGKRGDVSYDELVKILKQTPSEEKAEEWSRYYTSGPHLAGKNYTQALWTKNKWEEFGIKSEIVSYDVYLNYPVDHRLALLERRFDENGEAASWKVAFEATLEEDLLQEDSTSALEDRVPTFHGYSASGNVTGPVVYVNYGTYQDFEDLVKANVSLEGKVALARYGGIFRGLKVKRAQELGMIGICLYSDPGDDGGRSEANGLKPYPDGPARQPSSVQRGSVQFLSIAPGDPTTPGYPSLPGSPRLPVDKALPSIPSLPISYSDALPILKALNGHGPKSTDFNRYWTRNEGLGYRGVQYNVGPTPDHVVVNLYNEQEYVITPIWNVIGVIDGSNPHELVVVGNHRDAWIAGGAGDPNSGSAVLNEVIRSFGEAVAVGWKPDRSIYFASWDGEEYGLVGSTEWVEQHVSELNSKCVAYVNIDVGVKGKQFEVAAAPLLDNVVLSATAAVQSPNQTKPGQTVRDLWDGKIKTMGSGSDFTAFQDFVGIPSLDVGFKDGPDDPVYHYHSNYDSFHWMSTLADADFVYHRTMAQVLGLIVAQLVGRPVISFRAFDYATALNRYVSQAEAKLDAGLDELVGASAVVNLSDDEYFAMRARPSPSSSETPHGATRQSVKDKIAALHEAVSDLTRTSSAFDASADQLEGELAKELSWWQWPIRLWLKWKLLRVNARYKNLERNFLYPEGLDGRPLFKHVVFAPGVWTGYSGAVFPGLVESIDVEDWTNAERWVGIIEGCIKRASDSL